MIYMSINTHDYENDVRVMIQAFYPKEKIITDCERAGECMLRTEVSVTGSRIRAEIDCDAGGIEIDCDAGTAERKAVRNRLKRELYAVYRRLTGTELPWGTLTGIRPTKIPYAMLENGDSDGTIIGTLKSEYLMSEAKAGLSLSVAKKEHSLLSKLDYRDGCSLYIGIPFCPTTCLYCSFTSYPISVWQSRVDDYIKALEKELCALGGFLKGKKINTVYIGGGTPTTLLPRQLDRLLFCIEKNFDLSGMLEFTAEAGRPDSIDAEKLKTLRRHGVERISVNPQTMNQKTLDLIGRRHTAEQVVSAFETARECGFENINMDLIVGLPGEGTDEVRHTLEEAAKLRPDSLTVHSLAIKRAARLNIFKDIYADWRIENTDEIMELTHDAAASMGLEPYYLYRQKNMAGNFENVGYAKQGREGLYNILIMEEQQSIWAAGAGAQSKIVRRNPARVDRIENVKDVSDYIDRVDEMIDRKKKYLEAEGNE